MTQLIGENVMPRKKALVVLSSIVFALSACTEVPLKPDTLTQSDLSAENGVLVGAISRGPAEWLYTTYAVQFREVGTTEMPETYVQMSSKSFFYLGDPKFDDDFASDESSGAIFAYVLPPGEYEFYQYYLHRGTGVGWVEFRSHDDFSIKFAIEPGRITYVGEFRADPVNGKNMFGIFVPAGIDLTLHNAQQRDLSILAAKYPNLDISNVILAREVECEIIYSC